MSESTGDRPSKPMTATQINAIQEEALGLMRELNEYAQKHYRSQPRCTCDLMSICTRLYSALIKRLGSSSDETNCSDPGWEMRGGDLTCKGCGRKAREIFTGHDQEKASAAAVHLLSPKRCPDCGVQYVSGARHFSGCPSHPGESAQKAPGDPT